MNWELLMSTMGWGTPPSVACSGGEALGRWTLHASLIPTGPDSDTKPNHVPSLFPDSPANTVWTRRGGGGGLNWAAMKARHLAGL